VCFLSEEDFDKLPFQFALYGVQIFFSWQDNKSLVYQEDDITPHCAQYFASMLWEKIPEQYYRRDVVDRQIELWLQEYGALS
jgi:hypothetical protein